MRVSMSARFIVALFLSTASLAGTGAISPAIAASVAEDLINAAPKGGAELEKNVTDKLVADPAFASQFASLIGGADPELKKSLGRSFGAAVVTLSATPNSTAADPILAIVAQITDVDFLAAFADSTGQLSTAALGVLGGRLFSGKSSVQQLTPTVPSGASGPNTGDIDGLGDPTPNGVETLSFSGLDASISQTTL